MHILLIEDDIDLGLAISSAFRQEGISLLWVRTYAAAMAATGETPDCALLDLGLPDGQGLALLKKWRANSQNFPVIVITARTSLEDRLVGLDGGADDFMTKPFAIPELLSRLRAVTRRYAHQASECWCFGSLKLEPRSRQVWLDGALLDLSPREFQLLLELARNPDTVISKTTLGQRLEPLGDPLDGAVIEVHLSNLRRKIGAERIRTLRGVGYRFVS